MLSLQCVVDLDTQEPTDDLTPEAIKAVSLLGSSCTKVSEVTENQDRPIFDAIQQAIDKANQGAISSAQTVSNNATLLHTVIFVQFQFLLLNLKCISFSSLLPH